MVTLWRYIISEFWMITSPLKRNNEVLCTRAGYLRTFLTKEETNKPRWLTPTGQTHMRAFCKPFTACELKWIYLFTLAFPGLVQTKYCQTRSSKALADEEVINEPFVGVVLHHDSSVRTPEVPFPAQRCDCVTWANNLSLALLTFTHKAEPMPWLGRCVKTSAWKAHNATALATLNRITCHRKSMGIYSDWCRSILCITPIYWVEFVFNGGEDYYKRNL